MTQRKKTGDEGAGLLPWVQGLAPAYRDCSGAGVSIVSPHVEPQSGHT